MLLRRFVNSMILFRFVLRSRVTEVRHFARAPRRARSRGMSARWSRCHRLASVDAHVGSVKSVASGFWPAVTPDSVPERARTAPSSSHDTDPVVFATAGLDGATRVWRLVKRDTSNGDGRDVASDKSTEERAFAYVATCVMSVKGHASGVRAVAMAPQQDTSATDAPLDPKRAAFVTGSYDRTARLWCSGANGTSAILGVHGESVLCAAFTPDGNRVVTGAGDGRVRVWNAALVDGKEKKNETPSPLFEAETGFGSVRCVAAANAAFAPLAATGGEDGTVRVWRWEGSGMGSAGKGNSERRSPTLKTMKCELVLKGHARGVTGIALCPSRPPRAKPRDETRNASAFDFRIAAGGDTG